MSNTSARAGAQQALVPSTPSHSLLPQSSQLLAAASGGPPSAAADNCAARFAFSVAGTLLAVASISLAALNGWSRGASLGESVIWAGAGIALALVSLFGLSLALTSHGQRRTTAATAWVLALAFTLVAALGSQHGGRELAGRTEVAAVGNHARAQADYDRSASQLAALPATRPVAVIENELAVFLQDERLKGCGVWLDSARLRKTCEAKVQPARTELANARARAEAQAAMTAASAALGASGVARPANADASAVRRYLAAIGVNVGVDRLADILSLLTVFAVEFCGSAALALSRRPVASVGYNTRHVNTGSGGLSVGVNMSVNDPPGGVHTPVAPALNTPVNTADAKTAAAIERLKSRILGDLEQGPRSCSQRRLASEYSASVGYVNKALHELRAAGAVNVSTSRAGTLVQLA